MSSMREDSTELVSRQFSLLVYKRHWMKMKRGYRILNPHRGEVVLVPLRRRRMWHHPSLVEVSTPLSLLAHPS